MQDLQHAELPLEASTSSLGPLFVLSSMCKLLCTHACVYICMQHCVIAGWIHGPHPDPWVCLHLLQPLAHIDHVLAYTIRCMPAHVVQQHRHKVPAGMARGRPLMTKPPYMPATPYIHVVYARCAPSIDAPSIDCPRHRLFFATSAAGLGLGQRPPYKAIAIWT